MWKDKGWRGEGIEKGGCGGMRMWRDEAIEKDVEG